MLTIRELIKTLYNAFNQKLKKHRGNWEQNDPTADDYIKNRPFYIDESKSIQIASDVSCYVDEGWSWCSPMVFIPTIGKDYKVIWNNREYNCTAYTRWDCICIGNAWLDFDGVDTGEPFFYYWYDEGDHGWFVQYGGDHKFSIIETGIVKIDKKYLPDTGLKADDLAPVAISGNYWDLEDLPDIPDDVVRYNNELWLSTSQKSTALKNISAVGYESQNLTDTQKSRARANIGAGTSSFDSSYNSLTDVPNFADVAFNGDYNSLTNAPAVHSGGRYFGISYEWDGDIEGLESFRHLSAVYTTYYLVSANFDNSLIKYLDYATYDSTYFSPSLNLLSTNLYHFNPSKITKYNWGQTYGNAVAIVTDGSFATPGLYFSRGYEQQAPNGNTYFYYISKVQLRIPAVEIKGDIVLPSATENSSKQFVLSVNDSGVPSIVDKDDKNNIWTPNKAKEHVTLIDQLTGYPYFVAIRDGNLATYCATQSINVSVMPTKIEYMAGEHFSPEGMVIVANAYDGTLKEITNYTYSYPTANYITTSEPFVEILYEEEGNIYKTQVDLTVSTIDAESVLVDFDYVDNLNGTYTITGWKGTCEGTDSTIINIPNYSCIII